MPANPIFILLFLFVLFGVLSLVLKPFLNKDTRTKIARKTNDFYDINQTKPSEEADESTTQPKGD